MTGKARHAITHASEPDVHAWILDVGYSSHSFGSGTTVQPELEIRDVFVDPVSERTVPSRGPGVTVFRRDIPPCRRALGLFLWVCSPRPLTLTTLTLYTLCILSTSELE